MINLQFFPSRRLALYTVKLFVTRSLAVLLALVLVLMTLDLLGESGKILAVPGNGEAQLWDYVSLRLPLLISRFLPFAVLLGTLIAFTALNQHSEVVAMKAAGVSFSSSTRESSSTPTGTSPPGATTITAPSRPKAVSSPTCGCCMAMT